MVKLADYKTYWNKIIQDIKNDNILYNFINLFSSFNINEITDKKITFTLPAYNFSFLISKNISFKFENLCKKHFNNNNLIINYQCQQYDNIKIDKTKNLENFILNSNNRLAYAAIESIFTNTEQYNPIFIYAKTGLGKSHLLNGTIIKYLKIFPEKNLFYTNGNLFHKQYLQVANINHIEKWYHNIVNSDIFIIDDIQLLQNNNQSTNAFFELFEKLYHNKKQIIISSNSAAENLKAFPDYLISRLQWGLKIEITSNINYIQNNFIKEYFKKHNKTINENIIKYISDNFKKDYRQLEGIINTILFYAETFNKDITINLIQKIFNKQNDEYTYSISSKDIINFISNYFEITINDLKSKKRSRTIAFPRQTGMYFTKKYTNCSLEEIGNIYGGRDHSTVKHAIEKIKSLITTDIKTSQIIKDIDNKINHR